MTQATTHPVHAAGLPVRTVKVVVEGGPDAGREAVSDGESLRIGTVAGNDLVLTDPKVSRYHLELTPVGDRIRVDDRCSTNGTRIGAVTLRAGSVGIDAGTRITIGDTVLRVEDAGVVLLAMRDAVAGMVGRSPAMRQLMAKVERLAGTDASVLVHGESGTGKELVAKALHDLGPRAQAPFVTVDCAALSPTLVASELFGHERGAFTGAERTHVGAFERADGGTLFLDELGELPDALQAALLGALERRSFRRVGGSREIKVDVRVVCATNSDLRARVNAGTFRVDLYYRLAVVVLEIPPLRERTADVRPLIEHLLRQAGRDVPIASLFSTEDLAQLERHAWPGNVRELRNVVLRALATGEAPTPDPVRQALAQGGGSDPVDTVLALPYRDARRNLLDHFELRYLQALLSRTGGNVRAAARAAEMDRSYLTELLRRHGLA